MSKRRAAKSDHTSQKSPSRILLVDDHPIVRQGLTRLIDGEPDLLVCGEASDIRGAIDALASADPDLVVVDITLDDGSGIQLVKDIKARDRDLPVLVLSMHDEMLFAERVLKAGGSGYVMKQEPPEVLLAAVRQVLSGDVYFSPSVASKLLRGLAHGRPPSAASPVQSLSDREFEVYELFGKGKSTREVAKILHLSVKTIETHRERLKAKLGLKTAAELIRHSAEWTRGESAR
ncbi:MAG: response regulator transcription factor [Planctomycetota bacterium]|jgi:DNA-binding NarL/FixJ family response regulator